MKIKFTAIVACLIYANSTSPVSEEDFQEWLGKTTSNHSNVFETANNYFQRQFHHRHDYSNNYQPAEWAKNKNREIIKKNTVNNFDKIVTKAINEILNLKEPINEAFKAEKKLANGQTLTQNEVYNVFHEQSINNRCILNLNNNIYWLTKTFEEVYVLQEFTDLGQINIDSYEFLFNQFTTPESMPSEWNISINKIIIVMDLLQKYSTLKKINSKPSKNSKFSEKESVIGLLKQLHKDLKQACELMSQAA